ncbi:MAG: hypothetical protein UX09_C0032G0003 [Candidatus Uhrbacteria bacterium GW2011_GWE2_45_35]|uniref:Uncharacterized protein n=2 Tax=Candidatus Uhriibacteriota TaxID=1752732 RepID=A0A0G1JGC6_9BACT|nr:MAG: hypothetical protein UW63_C0026G0003 [Candidatus Uhrbacteria bacterium GW2011_GWF2_44_350]KKU07270.1 MAG: hypothetical protein UX09_C0032G0003 [Candidatus Uhrbacteria bacterium GW2011_GWE2_45_35]HBR80416.1 hypothetical protein [Candidatus Uhrbacteria bacterium]HCU31179.1 hypothetical protein [Candidatus Uhrbacteria bacterium]
MRPFIQSASAVSIAALAGEFLITHKAEAFCPVCTVAAAGGVGLARWLGIDDTITGLWIGGLIVSVSAWSATWLKSKGVKIKGLFWPSLILFAAITIIPLYWYGIMGHPWNTIWGLDKLLLGIIFGAIFFLAGGWTYKILKTKNNGRAHFPFEKVVLPVVPLIILSVVFYFLTK